MGRVLFVIIFVYQVLLLAQADSPKKFMENIVKNNLIGNNACKNNTPYVECYDVTIEQCKAIMHETTKKCYKKYKHYFTPEKTYNELKSIAAQVGSCAGVVYDMSLKITKKRNDKCLNDPKWTKVINNYNANKP